MSHAVYARCETVHLLNPGGGSIRGSLVSLLEIRVVSHRIVMDEADQTCAGRLFRSLKLEGSRNRDTSACSTCSTLDSAEHIRLLSRAVHMRVSGRLLVWNAMSRYTHVDSATSQIGSDLPTLSCSTYHYSTVSTPESAQIHGSQLHKNLNAQIHSTVKPSESDGVVRTVTALRGSGSSLPRT